MKIGVLKHPLLWSALALLSCFPYQNLHSDIVLVPSGTTETSTVYHNTDQLGIIEKGGSINTSSTGVSMTDGSLLNNGLITVNASSAQNINCNTNNGSILNQGDLLGNSNDGSGIYYRGNNGYIRNYGLISRSINEGNGILHFGQKGLIFNKGKIFISESQEITGIEHRGNDGTIINTGFISCSGNTVKALEHQGNNGAIFNSGMITQSGQNSYALTHSGANGTLVNIHKISLFGGIDCIALEHRGANGYLYNNSTIELNGGGSMTTALYHNGNHGTVLNCGDITGSGYSVISLQHEGHNGSITNFGKITGNGFEAISLLHEGDNGLIANFGALSAGGSLASTIRHNGNNGYIVNNGPLSVSGSTANGGYHDGDNAFFVNRSKIFTLGSGAYGFYQQGNNGVLINKGFIDTGTFFNGVGLFHNGDHAKLYNSGTITTSCIIGAGLHANSYSTLVNTGTISLSCEQNCIGLDLEGSHGRLINCGLISAGSQLNTIGMLSLENGTLINGGRISTSSNVEETAILHRGSNGKIANLGSIITTRNDLEGKGIHHTESNGWIQNRGVISSFQQNAIVLDEIGTVELLAGSKIQGDIVMPQESLLIIGQGQNLNLATRNTSGGGITPPSLISSKSPYVLFGNRIFVIDRSLFQAEADVLADLSDTVVHSVHQKAKHCGFWVEGFGSYRQRTENQQYDFWTAGALLGYTMPLCSGKASVFASFSGSDVNVSCNTAEATALTPLLGASYAFCSCWGQTAVTASFGWADWDYTRFVNNNSIQGGIEEVKSSCSGPTVSLAGHFFSPCLPLLGNPDFALNLQYAGMFLGDSKESSTKATNFNRTDRDLGFLLARAELQSSYHWVAPFVGLIGRYQIHGTGIKGSLAGQNISFSQGNDDGSIALLAGVNVDKTSGCWIWTGRVEASMDHTKSGRVLASVSLITNF